MLEITDTQELDSVAESLKNALESFLEAPNQDISMIEIENLCYQYILQSCRLGLIDAKTGNPIKTRSEFRAVKPGE